MPENWWTRSWENSCAIKRISEEMSVKQLDPDGVWRDAVPMRTPWGVRVGAWIRARLRRG